VKTALAGLKGLAEVTGDNRLARCMVPADWPFAAGIANEEAANTIHQNPPWIWADNTTRDQIVGAFFGLNIAFDLVDDPAVKSGASDVVTRLIGFISRHQWSPNDDASNTFLLRPDELQMLLQVARHVDPSSTISGPFLVPPVSVGINLDVLSNSSYFKFNLAYMSLYHLVSLQDNGDNRGAYRTLRDYTAGHRNPFFNLIDRALNGPDAARDTETSVLLEQWLQRPKRDFFVDLSGKVAACGNAACQPVPIPMRPPATFLWEVTPFQLQGGGSGIVENAGVDYILAYWMARYYGVIAGSGIQSAAAAGIGPAPASLASFYGQNLAASTAQAASQPLPHDSRWHHAHHHRFHRRPTSRPALVRVTGSDQLPASRQHCRRGRDLQCFRTDLGYGNTAGGAGPLQHEWDRLRCRRRTCRCSPGRQPATAVARACLPMWISGLRLGAHRSRHRSACVPQPLRHRNP
jgi:hypothetical protein